MSIYIKGMEMPMRCSECDFCTYGYCGRLDRYVTDTALRDDDCPLIEIPPHGRLIDADALSDMLEKYKTEYALKAEEDIVHLHKAWGLYEAELMSESLPTIIEAEECGCGRCDHCRINETGTCRYAEEATE